jgi:small subunit ribosomal protein S3
VIGRKGVEVENLKKELQLLTDKEIILNITEVKRPEIDAQLVSENVALQMERRVSFRRAMKRNVSPAMKAGAKGIKIMCAGRLAGAEMARTEWYREGRVPLQTLRADIDYGFAQARTKYGVIGVKVWLFKGEVYQEAR